MVASAQSAQMADSTNLFPIIMSFFHQYFFHRCMNYEVCMLCALWCAESAQFAKNTHKHTPLKPYLWFLWRIRRSYRPKHIKAEFIYIVPFLKSYLIISVVGFGFCYCCCCCCWKLLPCILNFLNPIATPPLRMVSNDSNCDISTVDCFPCAIANKDRTDKFAFVEIPNGNWTNPICFRLSAKQRYFPSTILMSQLSNAPTNRRYFVHGKCGEL